MKVRLLSIAIIIFISSFIYAQNEISLFSNNVSKKCLEGKEPYFKTKKEGSKIYFHLVGLETPIKIFIPAGRAMLAGNIGFGYKFSDKVGLGLNYGFAGDLDNDFPSVYTGLSLESRIQTPRWIGTLGLGKVLSYYNSPNDHPFFDFKYDKKKFDIFYRVQVGFRLKKKSPLTVGISASYFPEVNMNLIDLSTEIDTGMDSTHGGWPTFSIFFGLMTF